MKVLLFSTQTGELYPIDMNGQLDEFYALIETDYIDINERSIGFHKYAIAFDPEVNKKEDVKPSCFVGLDEDAIAYQNDIVITGPADEKGELTSLSSNDIEIIKNNLYKTNQGNMIGLDY